MTKSYEFNWQKHLPEFMQEGAPFDRFDEVRRPGSCSRSTDPEDAGCQTARPDTLTHWLISVWQPRSGLGLCHELRGFVDAGYFLNSVITLRPVMTVA